jgi:hypothetical protein
MSLSTTFERRRQSPISEIIDRWLILLHRRDGNDKLIASVVTVLIFGLMVMLPFSPLLYFEFEWEHKIGFFFLQFVDYFVNYWDLLQIMSTKQWYLNLTILLFLFHFRIFPNWKNWAILNQIVVPYMAYNLHLVEYVVVVLCCCYPQRNQFDFVKLMA